MPSSRVNVRIRGAQDARPRPSAVAARATSPSPNVNAVNPPPTGGGDGLIFSSAFISSLPESGAAWAYMKGIADGSALGTPNISNQNNFHQIYMLANALVYKKQGGATYRNRVVSGLRDIIGTEDLQTSGQGTILGVVRSMAAHVIAADLIGMDNSLTGTRAGYTSTRFDDWLRTLRSKRVGTHGVWTDIETTTNTGCTNFAGFGRGARVAISAYLDDDADIANCIAIFQRFCGDRTKHRHWTGPGIGASWQPSFVLLNSSFGATEAAQTTTIRFENYVGVGEFNNIGGLPYDGIIVGDLPRDAHTYDGNYGGIDWSKGGEYAMATLQGSFVAALILEHKYGEDAFGYSNDALKRAMQFYERAGALPLTQKGGDPLNTTSIGTHGDHLAWIADAKYGTTLVNDNPYTTAKYGRTFGFTDWLFS